MMKRKSIHHNRHPFDNCPFEVYWEDEWKGVDRLRISGGHITTHVVNDTGTFEADIRMTNLRLKSRKASELDCTCFLRPGVDICVFTNLYSLDNSDEEKNIETRDKENTDGGKIIDNSVMDNSDCKRSIGLQLIENSDAEQSTVTHLIDNSDGEKGIGPHRMDISEEDKSIEPRGIDNSDEDKSTEIHHIENSNEKEMTDPTWIDAKIRSVKRKPHHSGCTCEFYVSFYHTQGPGLVQNKLLHRDGHVVQLHQISIHQKLDLKPTENEFYRWGYSEDCSSLLKHKLFSGRFAADLSWLVVASVLKQTAFDVRSIQNKMVYEIFGDAPNSNNNELYSATSPSYAVNFKQDNDLLTPHVIQFVESTPETESNVDMDELGALVLYNPQELRRSKRRLVQPDRYLGCDEDLAEYEIDLDTIRIGAKVAPKFDEDDVPLALSVQGDNGIESDDEANDRDYSYEIRGLRNYFGHRSEKKSIDARHETHQLSNNQSKTNKSKIFSSPVRRTVQRDTNAFYQGSGDLNIPDDPSVGIGDIISKYMFVTGSSALSKKRNYSMKSQAYTQKWTGSAFRVRRHRRSRSQGPVKDSVYDVRTYKKGSVSAAVYRELMKRCMVDIDASINKEQPPVIDQWEAFKSRKFPNQNQHQEELSTNLDEEASELDRLWKEMELALASCYLLDDHEGSQEESLGSEKGEKYCHHDYRLNEEVGVICNICGFISIEIKNVSPSFLPTKYYTPSKEQRHDEVKELKPSEEDNEQFNVPAPSNSASTEGESEDNVWALIPSLRHKLRDHQKKAFEFLWRNVAGSIIPTEMEEKVKKRGGCVISHTPGAGKTLLIITFLVSYLKLFPGSRPLVLAPKTTLYTWYKEIIKWEIPVPVYQIHGGQTYKGEILRQKMKLNPGLPRNQDVMHVLDCLEKIQLWLSHPSILLMGYTSFMTLMREDSNYAHRKYMAQVLRQCPGILVLDEGHNPRSTKSRLRKALMKVNTKLRVLLSGTLFQNNFGEYFNTLCLSRPNFVSEVLKVLDPKYKRRKKDEITRFSRENRARKYFIDKISAQINSNVPEERMEGLTLLKNLTGKFIDIYEGSNSDQLPGLQCYTLMMKSTALQQGILLKLQNQRPEYKGFPLELELLITLGAIHPWLIRTTACSSQYFTQSELESLEQFKFDLKLGSKVRFVMSLIPRCLIRQEKVLIFCHNIAPINLFLDIFEKYYGWTRSEEVLVLSGEIELFERGRLIDKFEDPNGSSKVMLASINACAEGISLTAASRVILLDSEWNPSKSKQAIARAFRPGQEKVVYVYQLLATGTLEEEKYSRTTWKEWVSCMIFSEELVEDPSHWQAPKIEDELLREIVEEDRAVLFHRIMKNEKASNVIRGKSNVSYDNTPKDD